MITATAGQDRRSSPVFDSVTSEFWQRTLRRWNVVCWASYGVLAAVILVFDPAGPARTGSLVLLGILAISYAIVVWSPDVRPCVPYGYLCVLVGCLTGLAYLRGGYAALFIATLPHFWVLARSRRASIAFSGAGAAGTVAASMVRSGWSVELLSNNIISTMIVFSASILIGSWARQVVAESHERARLLAELQRTQAELADAHQRQGATEERERIAREIHDTLAQGFISIIVLAEAARAGLDRGHSARQLKSIEATARENLAEARALVTSAQGGDRPMIGSLAATLQRVSDRFTEDTGLRVQTELSEIDCDQSRRIALLRCTQESLANIGKHAHASTVGVVLARQPYGIELEITDDGIGFDIGGQTGFGLDGMRKRLAELGGVLTLTSSPGDGTRVLAALPFPVSEADR